MVMDFSLINMHMLDLIDVVMINFLGMFHS